MSRRRSSFPLDRVQAEALEPRILYSASPMPDWSGFDLNLDWSIEALHVAQAWGEHADAGMDRAAESEHHLSHLLDQTSSEDEWSLLKD